MSQPEAAENTAPATPAIAADVIEQILEAYNDERARFDGYKGPLFKTIKGLIESGDLPKPDDHSLDVKQSDED